MGSSLKVLYLKIIFFKIDICILMLYNLVYMNNKTKINKSEYMMLLAGAFVIMLIGLYDLNKHYCLTIINDEFSYWANAAQMAGKDWTSLISTSSFYSYGYSFLLIPLFWLGISMSVAYRIAIVMNVILLVLSFFMAAWLGMRLFGNGEGLITRRIIIFISLVVTLYVGNIFQLTVAWTEIPLYFVFWAIVVLIYRIIEPVLAGGKPKYVDVILLAAAAVYIYAIHSRTIGVTITVAFLILFIYAKSLLDKTPQHRLLLCLALMGGLFICASLFRGYTIEAWYENNSSVSMNDFSGQIGKVERLAKTNGLTNLLHSLAGKIYYQASSSFLLVLLPIISAMGMTLHAIFTKMKRKPKKIPEKWNAEKWVLFFCAVAFVLEVGIAALYKSGGLSRLRAVDVLYGRYPEFANGPLLLFAFAMLLMKRKLIKEVLIGAAVFMICAVSVGYQLHNIDTLFMNNNNAPGVFRIFTNLSSPMEITLYMTFISLGGFFLIGTCAIITQMKPPKNWKGSKVNWITRDMILLTISIIGIYWCVNGINIADEWVSTNGSRARVFITPIEEAMSKLPDDTEIYYIMPPYDDLYNYIKIYQSLDPDRIIHMLSTDELRVLEPEGRYVYMSRGVDIRSDMVFIERTEGLEVFVEMDSEIYRYLVNQN